MREGLRQPSRVSQPGADLIRHVQDMRRVVGVELQQSQHYLNTVRAAFDNGTSLDDIPRPVRQPLQIFPVYSHQPREAQALPRQTNQGINYAGLYHAEVGENAALYAENAHWHSLAIHGNIYHGS